jgi:alginate O-acetyltransferase complex protein AlgJ
MFSLLLSFLLVVPLVSPAAARREAISRTKESIAAECRVAAGGDWQAWQDRIRPFRRALEARLQPTFAHPAVSRTAPGSSYCILPWVDEPGEYIHSNSALGISAADDSIERSVAGNLMTPIVVGMSRWFGAQGIDLILVPVPIKPEVYPDKLLADKSLVPEDLNVIPHIRRRLLSFLEKDVEVVDLYPLFMKARKTSVRGLYMTADSHWREEPQRIAAREIANKLRRYPWVKRSLAAPPLYTEVETPRNEPPTFEPYLPPEDAAVIAAKLSGTMRDVQPVRPGGVEVTSPGSPVLVTGDSFVSFGYPLSGGLVGHIALAINQPVSVIQTDGNVVATFQDMFRDPSILAGKKVVVWVINDEPVGFDQMFPKEFRIPDPPRAPTKKR